MLTVGNSQHPEQFDVSAEEKYHYVCRLVVQTGLLVEVPTRMINEFAVLA